MRIVHFTPGRCNPDSANGVDKTVYYLSKTQAALGNEVAVFSLTAKPPIPIQGVAVKTYSPKGFPFILPKPLLRNLLKWQPDIVHLHSVYTPPNASLVRWLYEKRISYVVTPNGGLSPHVLRRRWYLKVPYKWIFELPLLNRAVFIHAVADADDIRNYGVRVPIVTAPNGLDISVIPPDRDKKLLASRFPQVRGKRVFMFLGRLDPLHKGLDLLLEGFSFLHPNNAILVLVGPNWRESRKTLEKLSHKLRIDSRVVFTSAAYGKEKFDLLAGADVFVHTSRWEGVPFSVLEASACRKPCLLTLPADPLGMISRYKAGFIVQPDRGSIAEGFQRFVQVDGIELKTMGTRAREMVGAEFNWGKIARTVVEAYKTYAAKACR